MTVVLVVFASLADVSVIGEVVLSDSGCDFVESQPFALFRKRHAFFIERQGGMSIEGTPEKTPPASRRKILAVGCGVHHRCAALYQAVVTRMENYLDRCESLEVRSWNITHWRQMSKMLTSGTLRCTLEEAPEAFSTPSVSREGVSSGLQVRRSGMSTKECL